MIEIKKVFRTYRIGNEELTVLNDISLKIGKGEFAAIVGPSGSGKSTLMHLIGGLDRPTKGSILIDGEDISSYRDNKMSRFRNEKVGFVFQAFNLEPALTAIENVMLPLLLAGIPEKLRREKARDMLESLGLGDRLYHRPAELSGGQKQRVSISRALVNKPKIILADEPTGNLDSKSGKSVMEMLTALKKQGYTVVMVTHNVNEAAYADRIIKIADGMLE